VSSNQSRAQAGLLTTVKQKVVYYSRYSIFIVLRFIYYILYKYEIIARPPPPVTISSLSDKYITLNTAKFLDSYNKYDTCDINTNIEKCFYDAKQYALAIEHADNELEKTWRRRIMFENTPRGNIIMYFDAYKQGFVYYSDNSNIPYGVINASIMKYVILFRCRDFFMDNQITPDNMHSPLLDIADTSDNSTPNEPVGSCKEPAIKSSAFAKLKNYSTISAKATGQDSIGGRRKTGDELVSNANESVRKTTEEKKHTRNKIIYSGKICNFNLLQKPNVIKPLDVASDLLDGIKENSNVQSQVFSYKDFKRMKG
jgi:hypothetical protein